MRLPASHLMQLGSLSNLVVGDVEWCVLRFESRDVQTTASGQAHCGTKVCIQCAYINGECKPANQGSLLDAAVGCCWEISFDIAAPKKAREDFQAVLGLFGTNP